jgi:hypothetical protein
VAKAGAAKVEDSSPKQSPDAAGDRKPKPATPTKKPPADTPAVSKPKATPAGKDPAVAVQPKLEMAILSVEFDSITLVDFADFVHQLTGVPVTLDIDAIMAKGLTCETELAVDLRGVTVRQILAAALTPHSLVFAVERSQLVISTTAAGKLEEVTLGIADLAPDDDRASQLADYVVTLIAPGSWQQMGGPGHLDNTGQSLVIRHSARVIVQVARFLDRLRAAEGLFAQSDLPSSLIDLEPLYRQVAEQLEQPILANFPTPTPVSRILAFLQTQADLRILVDWRALATVGWTPSTQTTLLAENQPLSAMLDQWLGRNELAYRIIDTKTLQISTARRLDQIPELELYPLAEPLESSAVEPLIATLKQQVGESHFEAANRVSSMQYDSASRCLLVSLPQPIQRQIHAQLLSQVRPTKPVSTQPSTKSE